MKRLHIYIIMCGCFILGKLLFFGDEFADAGEFDAYAEQPDRGFELVHGDDVYLRKVA